MLRKDTQYVSSYRNIWTSFFPAYSSLLLRVLVKEILLLYCLSNFSQDIFPYIIQKLASNNLLQENNAMFFLPKLSISVLYFSPTSGYKYSTFSKCSKCFILNSLLCFPKSNNLFAVPNITASIPVDFTGLGI